MSYLLDTNILLRLTQDTNPMHGEASGAVRKLVEAKEDLYIIPQNLIEFWAVATRPTDVNGLGLNLEQADREMAKIKRLFIVKLDSPAIFLEWEKLVKTHSVFGRQAHDAKIVAAMVVHRIDTLLTFNIQDFKRYNEIQIANPTELANS
jgi:predicted nucleic acid-binding protein